MTVLSRSRPSLVTAPGHRTPRNRPTTRHLTWATGLEGVGLTVLVAYSGTPGWQAIRTAAVLLLTAAVLRLQRAARRWIVGLVSFVAGLVGTVTGIGVGVMHLLKAGALLPTVCGLVVLSAGLPLLVMAAILIVGLLPRWWRLLALPAVYVVAEFVLFPVTAGIYATNVPAGRLGSSNPSDRGLSYLAVTFPASDGTRLGGWYVSSRNGAAVIVVPGSGSSRASVLDQGALLARHGYGVLFMDNRGHGTSSGTAMDFGWWGERDLAGAVSYLESKPDITNGRIAVLGESMGGEEAIGAIGADHRVKAVIAEGVTGRTFADTARLGSSFGDLLSRAQSWITYTTAGIVTDAPQPSSLVSSLRSASPRPVLVIAGRDELSTARYLENRSPGNVQVLDMPDSAHTAGLRTHPGEWASTVLAFLDRNMPAT